MLTILALVWFSASIGSPEPVPGGREGHDVTVAGAQHACPPEQPRARGRINMLLTSPVLPEIKARFDLGTASTEDVRLLTNPADREVCARLWEALEAGGDALAPTDAVTFYQSGNMYFAPVSRRPPLPPGVIVRIDGRSALNVYDSQFRLVGRFGA